MTTMLATGASQAETQLSMQHLDGLLTSQTVYLTTPGGEAVIHFKDNGTSYARLPNGTQMQGSWTLTEAGYCVDWIGVLQGSCTRVIRTNATLRLVDDASGDPRGQVNRIVPGNPEEF